MNPNSEKFIFSGLHNMTIDLETNVVKYNLERE